MSRNQISQLHRNRFCQQWWIGWMPSISAVTPASLRTPLSPTCPARLLNYKCPFIFLCIVISPPFSPTQSFFKTNQSKLFSHLPMSSSSSWIIPYKLRWVKCSLHGNFSRPMCFESVFRGQFDVCYSRPRSPFTKSYLVFGSATVFKSRVRRWRTSNATSAILPWTWIFSFCKPLPARWNRTSLSRSCCRWSIC